MTLVDTIRREIGFALSRAGAIVRRGIVQTVSSAISAQVEAYEGEVFDSLAVFSTFGLVSRSPAGTECVVARLDGSSEGAAVIAERNSTEQPTGLSVGDTVLHAAEASGGGQAIVHCRADGDIDLTPGTGQHVHVGGDSEALLLGDSMIGKLDSLNTAAAAAGVASDLPTVIALANALKTALVAFSGSASALAATKGKVA